MLVCDKCKVEIKGEKAIATLDVYHKYSYMGVALSMVNTYCEKCTTELVNIVERFTNGNFDTSS